MGARPQSPYIVWFDEYRDEDHPLVGGKNASLGTMMRAGLPVPPGFAISMAGYETLRRREGLRDQMAELLGEIDLSDRSALQRTSQKIRELIEAVPLEPDLEHAVRAAYKALCVHCDTPDVPVAVRSSCTAEDLPDASFAGQQDTYLWVTGADSMLEHVKRCWSSVFTDRAISYRQKMGHDHEMISMSVGIQKMVEPKAAGVAFTLNPTDGDRSQIAIDASWGLGEAVVAGEVTPDNFLIDKVLCEIVSRKISPKAIEYVPVAGGVKVVDVEPERQTIPCLSDEEIKAVARLARRAEKHYGWPQDIEWAVDRTLPEGENVVLLQSRPETVWSNKPRTPIATPTANPLEGIVSTLLSPVHTKTKGDVVDPR